MTPLVSPVPSNAPRAYFAELDFLRFFAASLVVYYHLGYLLMVPGTHLNRVADAPADLTAGPGALAGWVGVEIFFVISGIVIAQSAQSRDAISFGLARALRLYPAVFLTAPLAFVLLVLRDPADLAHLVRALAGSLVIAPTRPWLDDVFWTLAIEIRFYAIVAMTLAIARSRLRAVVLGIGFLSASWWALHAGSELGLLPFDLGGLHQKAGLIKSMLLLQHGCFFALGYLFYENRSDLSARLMQLLLAASCMCEILNVAAGGSIEPRSGAWLACALWVPAMAVIALFMGRSIVPAHGRAARLAKTLGQATYPLYLFHNIPGGVAFFFLVGSGVPALPALVMTAAACLAAALIIAGAPERALREALSRLSDRAMLTARRRRPAKA